MPSLGAPEIIIILVLALLVFGPKRLPEMGRSLGRTVREFKKASDTARKEFGVDEIEKEIKGVKTELKGVQKTVTDVKADLKIDVDAEAAKPDPGKVAGAVAAGAGAAAAGGAAATPDAPVDAPPASAASDAPVDAPPGPAAADEEVLVGDVVDEGPAVAAGTVDAEDAIVDGPVDVAAMTAGYESPAVSSDTVPSDPSPDEIRGPIADDEAAVADVRPQGA